MTAGAETGPEEPGTGCSVALRLGRTAEGRWYVRSVSATALVSVTQIADAVVAALNGDSVFQPPFDVCLSFGRDVEDLRYTMTAGVARRGLPLSVIADAATAALDEEERFRG